MPAVVAVAAVLSLGLAGCSLEPSASAGEDDLQVVATTTQVADFTRHVVGDAAGVQVRQLIQPNQSAHSYDPSAADLTALARADVLVENGVGLEEWLDDSVTASGFSGRTIHSSTGIKVMHADETGDPEHGEEHGNPHVWTDVANAVVMVENIAAGLAAADPGKADVFHANAARYEADLRALDEWIRADVAQVPRDERLLVSNHDALGYFTAAYGITYVGSVIPSFDDNAEPSAAEIDRLVAAIKKTGANAVFSEASVNPKAAKTISEEAHVAVYSGADALYVDSLGPAGSAGATYIAAQVHNVRRITTSWGATPLPLPDRLGDLG
ncbi:zinc ABC transporter substrate-binding protein [Cryobacterium tepidiphilum]|uniref:Zinc ABC transporter substrate-binding protein n=2 Tax=Cryobacterium tepidiphilum TaxID=2486026 RepID=A0A3M8LN65_9MICO|nr:zinc ABC transporter substrate-binding protein [Cryobacterium tepidiphilum]